MQCTSRLKRCFTQVGDWLCPREQRCLNKSTYFSWVAKEKENRKEGREEFKGLKKEMFSPTYVNWSCGLKIYSSKDTDRVLVNISVEHNINCQKKIKFRTPHYTCSKESFSLSNQKNCWWYQSLGLWRSLWGKQNTV